MTLLQLQTNDRGNVKLCPLTDFQVQLGTNDMVIVALRYVETIEQFDSGGWNQLQTTLTPQRARELAAALKKAAKLVLESGSSRN